MTIQIRTLKTYIMLYKLTKQVNYLRQARKLADELKSEQAGELTLFILSPKKD